MSGEAVLDRVLSAGDGIHLVLALEGSKDAPRCKLRIRISISRSTCERHGEFMQR